MNFLYMANIELLFTFNLMGNNVFVVNFNTMHNLSIIMCVFVIQ